MRRQSRLVTVTALLACGSSPQPPATAPEPVAQAPEPAAPATPAPRKPLNAADDQGRLIYAGRDGSCFVELPFPAGERPPPGKRPPTQAIDCPEEMGSPAWAQCAGGTIWRQVEGDGCECEIMANPPPPPRPVDCPS